jgi:hypothetical protein
LTDITVEVWAITVVWVALLVAVSRMTFRAAEGSVGLPLAMLLSTTFGYCGFIAYAVPGYSHNRGDGNAYLQGYMFTEETVLIGLLATVIGLVGFTAGCSLATSRNRQISTANTWVLLPLINSAYRKKFMLWFGGFALSGFVLSHFRGSIDIPMVSAVSLVGRNVATVIICLGAALAVHADKRRTYWGWCVLAVAIPAFYIIAWGFTSYGFFAFMVFAAFWLAVLARPDISAAKIGMGAALLFYSMLSVFVAWMSFRDTLRAGEDDTTSQRLNVIIDGFSKAELLSVNNFASLDWLNIRLNQYVFVGKVIEWHQIFPDLRLYGESLFIAIFAFVPRALWPGKPELGGSQFMAKHTGMTFSQGTTFGSGPVVEFYANFGYVGVFVGFLLLGFVVRKIDLAAIHGLRQGDLFEFGRWLTVGLAFNEPLTDFFFFVNTALISWLVMTALRHVMILKGSKQVRQVNSS